MMNNESNILNSSMKNNFLVSLLEMKDTHDITLKANPFYGKRYIIVGEVPPSSYVPGDEEMLSYLGAEKKARISSKIDFIITGNNPSEKTMKKALVYHFDGTGIIRMPYEHLAKIAREWNYIRYERAVDINADFQKLMGLINDIVDKDKERADFYAYNESYKFDEKIKRKAYLSKLNEEKKKEKKRENYILVFVIILGLVLWHFDAWGILLILVLILAFPIYIGKIIGLTIRSFLKK